MKAAIAIAALVVVAALGGTAAAYPQFQMSYDQTCTGCHVTPAGGTLLNENGIAQSESLSQFGTAPEFLNAAFELPEWLRLGGDLRGAGGYLKFGGPEDYATYGFPMQADLYAKAKVTDHISVFLMGGFRKAQFGHENATRVWSREHYVMWRENADDNYGLYVRVGRFMPVFGLRFAEHTMYTRRFGGTQLYGETYGAAVEKIAEKYELHVTGFVEDYLVDPVERANGAAVYGEYRLNERVAFGLEGMYKNFTNGKFLLSKDVDSEYQEIRFGVTNKLYLQAPDIVLSTEIQFVNGLVGKVNRSPDSQVGGAPKGIVGGVVASRWFGAFLVDLGLGHYDSNLRIKNLDRDCVDLNLHWFTTSHIELILNNRYEMLAFGAGGEPGIYSMLQLHYRL